MLALPSLDGIPARARVVARYRVRDLRPPPPPARLRIRRAPGFRRVVTWRGPRSLRYTIVVTTSDGRRQRYLRSGRQRRVSVAAVPASARLRVAIVATSRDGVDSRTARRRG